NSLQKRQALVPYLGSYRRTNVLGVDMTDAAHMLFGNLFRITTAEQAMAGIEKELRVRPGMLHQKINLVFALHYRSHVMMVDKRDTLGRGKFCQCFDARPKFFPARFFQDRTLG